MKMVKDTTDQEMEVKHQITEALTGTNENTKACQGAGLYQPKPYRRQTAHSV